MKKITLILLAIVCLTHPKDSVASKISGAIEDKLMQLTKITSSAVNKQEYRQIIKDIAADKDLQQALKPDFRILLLQAACLFKVEEKDMAINLIDKKIIPLMFQSKSGYAPVAFLLSRNDVPSDYISKLLNSILEGHAEIELIAVSDRVPLKGIIMATDVNSGQVFYIHSMHERATPPNARHSPELIPPGTYNLTMRYQDKILNSEDLEVTTWQNIVKEVNFIFPRELVILSPKQDEKLSVEAEHKFRWQWPLEKDERFLICVSRIESDVMRHKMWGFYETKDTQVTYNVDNTAFEETLVPGTYELSVFLSDGEKLSELQGKIINFEIIQNNADAKGD